jgi:hypothetical protein
LGKVNRLGHVILARATRTDDQHLRVAARSQLDLHASTLDRRTHAQQAIDGETAGEFAAQRLELIVQLGIGGGGGRIVQRRIARTIARLENGDHACAFVRAIGERQEAPTAINRAAVGGGDANPRGAWLAGENLWRRTKLRGDRSGGLVIRDALIFAPLANEHRAVDA